MITTDSTVWISLGIAVSGFGEGIFMPVVDACFLDIAPEEYRGRVIGFKQSMFSLGGLIGLALIVLVVQYLQPERLFLISGGLILLSGLIVPMISFRSSMERSTNELSPSYLE